MKRVVLLVMLAVAASGCQTIKNIFNDVKKENIEPPTPLVEIAPTAQLQPLWQEHVGKGSDRSGIRVAPAFANGKIYAAGTDGSITALDAASGKTLWSKHFGKRHGFIWHHGANSVEFAGGPGTDGTIVVVGTLEGGVQAFNANTGDERWTSQVSSEVDSAPVIADNIVVVRANDGRIYGLDAHDGSRKWTYDRSSVPVLTLRGNAGPQVADGLIYSGADNGKLVAVTLNEGKTAWEQTVSTGEGRTEIERIQDVDGPVAVVDGVVYASGYHGQVVALIAQTGRPLWTHAISSYTGVTVAPTQLYVVDTESVVWALDLRTGASNWKQDALKFRWLSPPAAIGEFAVAGDLEGWVHVLDASDGHIAARARLSKHAIVAQPLVVGDVAYIEDVNGVIGAWRISK